MRWNLLIYFESSATPVPPPDSNSPHTSCDTLFAPTWLVNKTTSSASPNSQATLNFGHRGSASPVSHALPHYSEDTDYGLGDARNNNDFGVNRAKFDDQVRVRAHWALVVPSHDHGYALSFECLNNLGDTQCAIGRNHALV